MAEKTTAKATTKATTAKKEPSKGTPVEVILSVYKYKDFPVSVVGIKDEHTNVKHDIEKNKIASDGWFEIASFVKSMPRLTDEQRNSLINEILSTGNVVHFLNLPANEQRDYATLKHSIIKKVIEV